MRAPARPGAPPAASAALLAVYVLTALGALALGAYAPLFFGEGERGGQGIDFFCVPKAFHNLLAGRSAFDTWGSPPYGPYATWFVLHPAVAVWVGGYLAWLSPWAAYGAWVGATLALFVVCGLGFARHVAPGHARVLVLATLLASPVTYLLLHCGNIHGLVVAACGLVLLGLGELDDPALAPAFGLPPARKVALGLAVSLLSKPLLLLVVPALLVLAPTRRPALLALATYAGVSALFLLVPWLNPEPVGLARLAWLSAHPGWVQSELNVYTQRFVLVPEMLDNAMHWLHMVAQSRYAWDHVQVFSLPVWLGAHGAGFSALGLLPLVCTPLVARAPAPERARRTAWLVILALATHFLGYAVAWEYQYTQLLVVVTALLALPRLCEPLPRWAVLALWSLALLYLPTPYFALGARALTPGGLALIRAFRVGPALLVALAALVALVAPQSRPNVSQLTEQRPRA